MSEPRSIRELNEDLFDEGTGDRYADPVEARRKAMDYLARRDYGRSELERKLTRAGFAADVVADAVARLADEGLQDDRRYADSFIQSRIGKGKGPVRIRQELIERGIPESAVNEALGEREDDWFAMAREIRQKKFGSAPPDDFREKARQMRFLQYRGFDTAHIQAAVEARGDD